MYIPLLYGKFRGFDSSPCRFQSYLLKRLVRLLPPENLEDWLEEKRTAKDLLQDGNEQFSGFLQKKNICILQTKRVV